MQVGDSVTVGGLGSGAFGKSTFLPSYKRCCNVESAALLRRRR